MDKWLWMLSARRIMSRAEGDCNVVRSRHGSVQADFRAWKVRFLSRLQALARGEKKSCGGTCKKGGSCKKKKKHREEEEEKASSQNDSEVRFKNASIPLFLFVLHLFYFSFFVLRISLY